MTESAGRSYTVDKMVEQNGHEENDALPTTESQPSVREEQMLDAEDFQAYMEATDQKQQRGQLITGVVVHVGSDGVSVDIGSKKEAFIPSHELTPDDEVNLGDQVEAILLKPETDETPAILSKRRADYEKTWRMIEEAHANRKTVEVLVKDKVKGGLIVDIGLEGFIPASHVAGSQRDLERMVGRTIPVRVIEVDKKKNKIICSHRTAIEEDRAQKRAETLASLEENKIVEGIVRRITDFGAFIDLGGVDGLLHVREMSWTRVNHPSDVVKKGQKVQVVVLEMDTSDPNNPRISLGMKQLQPDPWKKATKKLRVNQIVHGKVTRTAPAGAFVLLDEGIEGIVPLHELSDQRVSRAEDVVQVGEEVDVRVIAIKSSQRRLTLSLKQVQQERERERERNEYRSYAASQKSDNVTIGDVLGDALVSQLSQSAQDSEGAKAASEG
ncbi:MAG: S1 RNA-binding domain-containing protein [Abditibacteriales bacterium]|nr:S1 RNA-binding domain-containing protein [Abditibacteriales bacterium]MDW8365642.1 S1 RNA-binding domain-containing protein [Abditibacteriales bacterium]